MDDLYGARAHLDQDARALAKLGDPVFVVLRPQNRAAAPDRTTLVYEEDGYRVYALRR